MNTALASPEPTTEKQRCDALDVLRGFALLGILVPNILAFASTQAAYWDPAVLGDTPWNRLGHDITAVLFQGKFMEQFAILFGAGVVFFDRKTTNQAGPKLSDGAGLWYTRNAWLLVFGLLHAVFLWYGDILVAYAFSAMLALWWLRKLKPVTLIVTGLGLHALMTILFTFIMIALIAAAQADPDYAKQIFGNPGAEQTAHLGPYAQTVGYRLTRMLPEFWFWYTPLSAPGITGLMLIGAGLTKFGVLTGARSPRLYATLAIAGVALGLTTTLAGYAVTNALAPEPYAGFLWLAYAQFLGLPLGFGYACCLLWAVASGVLKPLTRALANIGRTAFSNYIAHSLICSTLFYGYGFGLFGSIDYPGLFGVVAGVWAFNFLFSALWLRAFRFGPLEWLWRSLTYQHFSPIRR